jgi:hypothetical protein
MTGEPYAGADPQTDIVYVMWGDRGLGVRITPDLQVYEWFVAPTIDMIPLLDEVIDRDAVLSALSDVRLPKRVRDELAEVLRADADDIGKRS